VKQDVATVTSQGTDLRKYLDGVTFREVPIHIDERGSTCELFDPRWNWHPDPMVFSYFFTVRPGFIKGWGLHKLHEDRYHVVSGELEVTLYDVRPTSSTYKQVCQIVLSEYHHRIMNIPTNVWHAVRNIGARDCITVNFPSKPYDHMNPDKYRLPLDTSEIPFRFAEPRGW